MNAGEEAPLESWIECQLRGSADRLLAAVSATHLQRLGPRRGQTMRPAPGSVLAAAQAAPGPDEPDYFFHWTRDAALIVNALLSLQRCGRLPAARHSCFSEWLGFENALSRIDGRAQIAAEGWPPDVPAELERWLRPREEIVAVRGAAVAAEARYNPDGSLDLLRWGRPQHDGPALRALTTMNLLESGLLATGGEVRTAERLLSGDLRFCLERCGLPSYDPWEEELGRHFYTRLLQHAALGRGAALAEAAGHPRRARRLSVTAGRLGVELAEHWSARGGFYRSRLPGPGVDPEKSLDSSVLLAVLHAGLEDGPFGMFDRKVEATVTQLEQLFADELPLNAGRGPVDGIMLGRYAGDRYFDGGAWPIACFGLAEFHYRLGSRGGSSQRAMRLARGDALLSHLRRLLPHPGPLPEQLDRLNGDARSAKDLAWSHAAFVKAAEARGRLVSAGTKEGVPPSRLEAETGP